MLFHNNTHTVTNGWGGKGGRREIRWAGKGWRIYFTLGQAYYYKIVWLKHSYGKLARNTTQQYGGERTFLYKETA